MKRYFIKSAAFVFYLLHSIQLYSQNELCISIDNIESQFQTGTSIIQNTLFGDPVSVQNGQQIIYNSSHFVNQHLMGFGALNPEPVDNSYELSSLEERIGITNGIVKDAEQIVLTACCAPDWMKGGLPGETDWSKIELAPLAVHYQDYADLVIHVVQQDEFQNIKYIQVWNEMKGLWDAELSRWNYEGYTELYNLIWNGVKDVRPDIKIGGPYVVLNTYLNPNGQQDSGVGGAYGTFDQRDLDVIEYWMSHKDGADFIILDGKLKNRDVDPSGIDQWAFTEKFVDASNWIRQLNHHDAQHLPIWWAEWYTRNDTPTTDENQINALMTLSLMKMIKAGNETALLWSAQGDNNGFIPNLTHNQLALFTNTTQSEGGLATAFASTHSIIKEHFSAGTIIYDIQPTNSNIEALISQDKMLLMNKSNSIETTMIRDESITLSQYEIKLMDTPDDLLNGVVSSASCNFIRNASFDENTTGWTTENCTASAQNQIAEITSIQQVANPWDAKFIYPSACLIQGSTYVINADIWSSMPRSIKIKIGEQISPFSQYFITDVSLTTNRQKFSFEFTMNDIDALARLEFQVGSSTANIFIDDVIVKEKDCFDLDDCDLIRNGKFDFGLTEWTNWNCAPLVTVQNECQLDQINVVANPWEAALAYGDLFIEQGNEYRLQFSARSTAPRTMNIKIGKGAPDWEGYFQTVENLTTEMQSFEYTFTMTDQTSQFGRIEFQIGGSQIPIIVDHVRFEDKSCLECPSFLYVGDLDQQDVFQSSGELTSDVLVPSSREIEFLSAESILLLEGFEVEEQALFSIMISSCE